MHDTVFLKTGNWKAETDYFTPALMAVDFNQSIRFYNDHSQWVTDQWG